MVTQVLSSRRTTWYTTVLFVMGLCPQSYTKKELYSVALNRPKIIGKVFIARIPIAIISLPSLVLLLPLVLLLFLVFIVISWEVYTFYLTSQQALLVRDIRFVLSLPLLERRIIATHIGFEYVPKVMLAESEYLWPHSRTNYEIYRYVCPGKRRTKFSI